MGSKKNTTPQTENRLVGGGFSLSAAVAACAVLAALGGISPFGLTQNWDLTLLVTSGAVFAGVLMVGSAPRASGRGGTVTAVVLAYVVWAVVSASQSAQPWSSLFGSPATSLGAVQLALAGTLLIVAIVRSDDLFDWLLRLAPVLLGFEVAVVAAQAVSGIGPTSTSNATFLAQVAALCLPITLLPVLERRGVVWRSALTGLTLLALGAVGTRMGVAVAAVIIVGFAAAWVRGRGGSKRPLVLWGLIAAGVAASGLLALPRILLLADPIAALGSRPQLWSAAVSVWRDSPVFGSGPDGFRTAVAASADAEFLLEGSAATGFSTLPGDPHSLPLLILATTGAVGLAIALAFAISVVRAWRRVQGKRRMRTRWLVVGVVGYAVTALLAPVTIQTLPLAALVLGVSIAGGGSRRETEPTAVHRLGLAALALGILAVVCVVPMSTTRLAVGRLEQVTAADAERAGAAAELWSVDPLLHYAASWRWYEAAVRGSGPVAWQESLVHARRAAELEPHEPVYALNVATTLAASGAPSSDVITSFEAAMDLMPASVEAHVAYGRYLLAQGDSAGANEHLQAALAGSGPVPWVHAFAADVYEALGDLDQAAWHRRRSERLTSRSLGQ